MFLWYLIFLNQKAMLYFCDISLFLTKKQSYVFVISHLSAFWLRKMRYHSNMCAVVSPDKCRHQETFCSFLTKMGNFFCRWHFQKKYFFHKIRFGISCNCYFAWNVIPFFWGNIRKILPICLNLLGQSLQKAASCVSSGCTLFATHLAIFRHLIWDSKMYLFKF